jgi:L-ribulose-5-phosphate 3-epimerase
MLIERAPLANRIGFMQGRLSEPIGDRGRCFVWDSWRDEFPTAQRYGFEMMEWRLGGEPILMNPLMSASGRDEMRSLCCEFGICIPSLAADFIKEAPFYKVSGRERRARLDVLGAVVEACAEVGIALLVVPLVNDGKLCTSREIEALRSGFDQIASLLDATGIVLAFESDFAPARLASLIGQFPAERFGITYDIGHSASLGFDSSQEIAAYGNRIVNVHVKDWIPRGSSIPWGAGCANLASTLSHLRRAGYQGNLILQTPIGANCRAGLLAQYRAITATWWSLVDPDGFGSRL